MNCDHVDDIEHSKTNLMVNALLLQITSHQLHSSSQQKPNPPVPKQFSTHHHHHPVVPSVIPGFSCHTTTNDDNSLDSGST